MLSQVYAVQSATAVDSAGNIYFGDNGRFAVVVVPHTLVKLVL